MATVAYSCPAQTPALHLGGRGRHRFAVDQNLDLHWVGNTLTPCPTDHGPVVHDLNAPVDLGGGE
ncbi:hypothetical protein D3C83_140120 [compost metagenome]